MGMVSITAAGLVSNHPILGWVTLGACDSEACQPRALGFLCTLVQKSVSTCINLFLQSSSRTLAADTSWCEKFRWTDTRLTRPRLRRTMWPEKSVPMGPVRDGIQGAVHKDFIHSLTRRSFANPNTPFFQVFMAGLKRIMHFHLDMGPLCPLTEDPDQVQLIHSDTQRKTIKNLGQEQNRYKQVFPLAVCCTCSKQRCPARRGTTWHDVDLNVLRGQAVTRMCLGASRVRWKECLKSTSHLGFSWAYSVHQTHKGVLGILGQDSANQNLMMP